MMEIDITKEELKELIEKAVRKVLSEELSKYTFRKDSTETYLPEYHIDYYAK